MKKILLIIFVLLVLGFAGYYVLNQVFKVRITSVSQEQNVQGEKIAKTPILRFMLVADSENDNDLLEKAINQAKGSGINFLIGLGDWSSVGTETQLAPVKKIFDDSQIPYYLTAGDHDLWDSRNQGKDALTNYNKFFGDPSSNFQKNGVEFVIVDNSDIYKGIDQNEWQTLNSKLQTPNSKLTFVFAHKTPFHPQSSHIMGEGSATVTKQAGDFMALMEDMHVSGFFSGDLHFFAQYNSPDANVKITTVGAVDSDRNFQGPRFALVTVYNDYSWDVADQEIR